MYRPALLACLLLATALPLAATAAPTATRTPQQQRMADCSAKNKGMKGDAYKQAQRSCLSTHAAPAAAVAPAMAAHPATAAASPVAAKPMAMPMPAAHTATAAVTPQQRMASCNTDAASKHLAGDARKTFMSSCLRTH